MASSPLTALARFFSHKSNGIFSISSPSLYTIFFLFFSSGSSSFVTSFNSFNLFFSFSFLASSKAFNINSDILLLSIRFPFFFLFFSLIFNIWSISLVEKRFSLRSFNLGFVEVCISFLILSIWALDCLLKRSILLEKSSFKEEMPCLIMSYMASSLVFLLRIDFWILLE